MKVFTRIAALFSCLFFFSNQAIAQEFNGYALYNDLNGNTTYLIDKNADIAHTWQMNTTCNYAVLLMPSGNIMRGTVNNNNIIDGAAVGGRVQEIDPSGNVVWDFIYSSADYVAHHDITLMPNGGVLLTAWEVKNANELDAAGYTGNSNVRYPTHFIEVVPDGNGGGEIVWEWHIWDHLIQDVDPNLPNYGVVSEHPELMDINVETSGGGGPGGPGGPGGGGGDWFHINGVDYNEELDLITFTSRYLNEFFIIDHSATMAEAAGHTGGNFGKGGDFLYRWGKPANFGVTGTQHFAGPVHDARWITDDGRPRGGYIQVFSNDGPDDNGSTVEAIELPWNSDMTGFEYTAGMPYGPSEATFRHDCINNANGQSASNSMSNGNVFVNLSMSYMYEVDLNDNVVFQYSTGAAKAFRYECDYPGIKVLKDTGVIEDLCSAVSTNEISTASINISPNPSKGLFAIDLGDNTQYEVKEVKVFDFLGKEVLNQTNASALDLSDYSNGLYLVTLQFENEEVITKRIIKN